MSTNPNGLDPPATNPASAKKNAATPAEDRDERIEIGRDIARGGKQSGRIPGAAADDVKDPRAGKQAGHSAAGLHVPGLCRLSMG
jgi:hypothetical protein